jgi:hypothetical protein
MKLYTRRVKAFKVVSQKELAPALNGGQYKLILEDVDPG